MIIDKSQYEVTTISENSPLGDLDPLHIQAMSSEWSRENPDILIVSADDGNESSWGYDHWKFHFQPEGVRISYKPNEVYVVELVESFGRDCFDENLSDMILHDGTLGYGTKIFIDEFNRQFRKFHHHWFVRTMEQLMKLELFNPFTVEVKNANE